MNDEMTQKLTKQNTATQEIRSTDLFGGARELIIIHNDERYCLRITANQKLILTK